MANGEHIRSWARINIQLLAAFGTLASGIAALYVAGLLPQLDPLVDRMRQRVNGLRVEVTTDKNRYRDGDILVTKVKVNRDAHLHLYHVNSEGKVTRVFPNSFTREARIVAGAVVTIPDPTASFALQAEGPPFGQEQMIAVAAEKAVDLSELSSVARKVELEKWAAGVNRAIAKDGFEVTN